MNTRIRHRLSLLVVMMGVAWGATDLATITVEVWVPGESKLDTPNITLIEVGTRKEHGVFRSGRAAGVPYGQYLLRVQQPGFRWVEQEIRVYQPEVFSRVFLLVANMPSNTFLKGVLKSPQSDDWVKLVSIRSNNTPVVETKVRKDGSFELTGFDGGDYLLLVVRGLKVIYSEQLAAFYGSKTVEITIP